MLVLIQLSRTFAYNDFERASKYAEQAKRIAQESNQTRLLALAFDHLKKSAALADSIHKKNARNNLRSCRRNTRHAKNKRRLNNKLVAEVNERKNAEDALQERQAHMLSLLRVSERLEFTESNEDIYASIINELAENFEFENHCFYLLHSRQPEIIISTPEQRAAGVGEEHFSSRPNSQQTLASFAQAESLAVLPDAQLAADMPQEILDKISNRTLWFIPIRHGATVYGVIVTDLDGKITRMNRNAEAITGLSREQALGSALDEVCSPRTVDSENSCHDLRKTAVQTGELAESFKSRKMRDAQGKEKHVAYNIAPIRDAHSRIIGAVVVVRDTTEQEKMTQEFLKSQKLGGVINDVLNGVGAQKAIA